MKKLILLGLILGLVSCGKNGNTPDRDKNGNTPENLKMNYTFDFNSMEIENWKSFFTDYPVGEESFYELTFKHSNLPEPLDTGLKAIKISGSNRSADLFSAIYRKFDGLKANRNYSVTFDIDFASDAPTNAVGAGGSPDISLGAGGINFMPKNTVHSLSNFNTYRSNFESKLQAGLSNEVFQVLGTIGVSDNFPTSFMLINRNNLNNPIEIKSNSDGEFWLMIATDSGFEGITTLYYKSIKISFE